MYIDEVRRGAYATALRNAVTPESIVLDIGAGTGIFALLACSFGARRVYAVEPNDAIHLAREIAAANGYADRVTCIQALSTKVNLPERVDVIISDIGGLLPLFGHHISAIMDARERHLVPGGLLIAQQDRLRGAVVEARDTYHKLMKPWCEKLSGLDLSAGRRLVANTWGSLCEKEAKLLTQPSTLAVIDYRTITESKMSGNLTWTMQHAGTGHGVAVWFDRTVADGIELSNEPGAGTAADTYGSAWFPWPESIDLVPGDQVSFQLRADLLDEQYIWRWETIINACGDTQDIKANFCQSSLKGLPFSLASLKERESEYVPAPTEDARIDAFILSKIDGHSSLREIAKAVAAKFPSRFKGWEDALSHVGDLTARDAER
jgi:protein arginine N-methyltransferase 1